MLDTKMSDFFGMLAFLMSNFQNLISVSFPNVTAMRYIRYKYLKI
jgi:hypothetical protein